MSQGPGLSLKKIIVNIKTTDLPIQRHLFFIFPLPDKMERE